MSKINPEQIQQVKEATNIVEVISSFLSLQRKGSGFIGTCPFHSDKHPSMRVNPSTQTYKCFVCGAGGDVFEFLQQHEQMTFVEAVRWCAQKAGIQIEVSEQTLEEIQKAQRMDAMRIAIEASAVFFQSHLPQVKPYLEGRGYILSDTVLSTFRVGYAPESNIASKQLIVKGYSPELLTEVNVLVKGKYGLYDVFQDRIMFPFLDMQGRVLGFSGRYITPKANTGKYVNTAETPLFTKGKNVFGLYQAKKEIIKFGNAYLVEGQFDVLSMHLVGVCNTIAGSGTALTEEQIKQIHRFTPKVTLVYDADEAGINASLKNCEAMLCQGMNVNCVLLADGKDPDNLAQELKDETAVWLRNHTLDFVTYFCNIFKPENIDDPIEKEGKLSMLCNLISCVDIETLRYSYARSLADRFFMDPALVSKKIEDIVRNLPPAPKESAEMKPGIYGLDILQETMHEGCSVHITDDFSEFLEKYGDTPQLYIHQKLSIQDIQELRRTCQLLDIDSGDIYVSKNGEESPLMQAMAMCFRNGLQNIAVTVTGDDQPEDHGAEEDDGYCLPERTDTTWTFINFYIFRYNKFFTNYRPYDNTPYIQRCAELISYADDSVRIVNFSQYTKWLDLTKAQLQEILKPYLAKRKSRMAINAQRSDEDDEYYDPDTLPDYVENEPMYKKMYNECRFYPKLNKDGIPVCYIFRNNDNKGHTLVGDFFMEPLLHIQSDDDEQNKRVLKINRRYYKNPLYIEVNSKALLKKSTIEERLIMLEAVNFTDGEEKHWTKIKEWMSRNFVTCTEVKTYGNQQIDGASRKEDNMFFAFANGIYHQEQGKFQFSPVNELGVVTHNKKNYYLPAFSNIYAGSDKQDKYELISQLFYKDIAPEKQCSFEQWTSLMDRVYKINDNGKWAILFAIMCAFRSNIHCIDRLFTAPFFMGPMSSGKTQIAISIRSLFISPKIPIFNLNIGTDAAMSTLMGTFRDVPVVLDEYNNKDISDIKFQALKGIVYDGDGRQKRKGTSGKEIENDKVYAPVIICGQETPQRDDNALMSRIIVCEVPKPPTERSQEEIDLFNRLKEIEENGLSNVLVEILQLRTLVMDKFRELKQECYKEIKHQLANTGEIDRLMKTASLFLATCRLIEEYTRLKLPFTYQEFFKIACDKIRFQVELISKTDKLATFFKAMDVMIDTQALVEGRDFQISAPGKLTIKAPGGERKELPLSVETRVLFLRLSNIYTLYARSSYNNEASTQSTIEQNLRSNPAYLGIVNSKRFIWYVTVEVPRGGLEDNSITDIPGTVSPDNTMVKKREKQEANSSCIALNYDIFRQLYDIDLQRAPSVEKTESDSPEEPLPF